MKSRILITPTNNITENRVIDLAKIDERIHDSDMDVFTFRNVNTNHLRRSNLMSVSLYDDVIVEDDVEFKIISMLTR